MGIFQSLVSTMQGMRKRSAQKAEFIRLLVEATADGQLSKDEMQLLVDRFREIGLTNAEIKNANMKAYLQAYNVAKADNRITVEEERELQEIKRFLKIDDVAIAGTTRELQRLRILTEIEQGNLPEIELNDLARKKGEISHWSEPGSLIEERVVRRGYQGGSHGVSFRIMKGVSYRIGAHRGKLVSEKANVAVSEGELIITNLRVAFRGDQKSFNLLLSKVLDVDLFSDAIRITGETGKPRLIQFGREGNADIVGMLVTRLLNS